MKMLRLKVDELRFCLTSRLSIALCWTFYIDGQAALVYSRIDAGLAVIMR